MSHRSLRSMGHDQKERPLFGPLFLTFHDLHGNWCPVQRGACAEKVFFLMDSFVVFLGFVFFLAIVLVVVFLVFLVFVVFLVLVVLVAVVVGRLRFLLVVVVGLAVE